MNKKERKLIKAIKEEIVNANVEWYKTKEHEEFEEVFKQYKQKQNEFVTLKLQEKKYIVGKDYIEFEGIKVYSNDFKKESK